MQIDIINIGLAFLEGFALIISPCILPILPIILSGSLTGNKSRPLGIVSGFILAFSLFTFFSRALVRYSGIDLNIIRNISFVLLFAFGVVMLSTYLTEKFNSLTSRFAAIGPQTFKDSKYEFFNGILFGGLIGIIWTPCAGPLLAAVIVQSVLQASNLSGFLIVLAFGIGAGVPMLIIALFGRSIMTKFNIFREKGILFRKILGGIILLSVIYMMFNTTITAAIGPSNNKNVAQAGLINGIKNPYPAPAIAGNEAWINSPPLSLSELKGKVVLIDFWTYSCINCIRTLPYLKDWYQKYHDKGLVIIGVHSPEFDFERDLKNVKSAVEKDGILYPVVLDNQFVTWQNFHNSYWPAHYLINKQGEVVYEHFGEGEYETTENNIRFLLGLSGGATTSVPEESISSNQTPETYLGYARAENFDSPEVITRNLAGYYTYPAVLPENKWALSGGWQIESQRIVSTQQNSALKIHFRGQKVFAVIGISSSKAVKIKLLLNGELVVAEKGDSVTDSSVNVVRHDLYTLINLKQPGSGILELIVTEPGVEIYTFTFG